VLLNLLTQCDPGHTIHQMPQSPVHSPDICQSESHGGAKGNDNFVPCCCNRVAYALRQACWSCQQGRVDPIVPDHRPTFGEYLQCDRMVNHPHQVLQAVNPPPWALVPLNPDLTWNFTDTRLKALTGNIMIMEGSNPLQGPQDSSQNKGGGGDDDDDSHNNDGGKHSSSSDHQSPPTSTDAAAADAAHKMMVTVGAVAGGIFAGLFAVAVPFVVVMCVKRRRRRQLAAAAEWWNRYQDEKRPYEGPYPFSSTASPSLQGSSFNTSRLATGSPSLSSEDQFTQPIPRPVHARGKADKVLGTGVSWTSEWARPIRSPPETAGIDNNFDFEAAIHSSSTQVVQLTDERVRSGWAWSPIARVTPSMIHSPSRKSSPRPTIMSFANTEKTQTITL